jgi:hypothetical protein
MLTVAALSIAASSARAAAPRYEADDPRGRAEARALVERERSVEGQMMVLQAAHAATASSRSSLVKGAARVPGLAWVNLGPNSGVQLSPLNEIVTDSGRAQKIVPHPTDPNILYLATSGGGVWKTFSAQAGFTLTGGGPTWSSITDQLGSQSIGAFALDPSSPDTLFLALGDSFDVRSPGFFHSADGGISWSSPIALHGSYGNSSSIYTATRARDIVVNPNRTGVVLVATDAGLFRSTEGGVTENWQLVDLDPTHAVQSCWSIAWVGDRTWLVTCESSAGSLWRSSDDGASWQRITLPTTDVSRMTVAAAAGDSAAPDYARVYLAAAWDPAQHGFDTDQKDLFRSDNGGRNFAALGMEAHAVCDPSCPQPTNWTNDQDNLDVMHDQAWYNQALTIDPRNHDRVFVGGNLALLRTQNGGSSWDVVADWLPGSPVGGSQNLPYVHADWHAMAISTAGATPYFYGGTDGGLFRSSDVFAADASSSSGSPPRFESRLNRGIVTHLLYSLAMDEHNAANLTLMGGLQDNGTRLRVPGAPTTFNQVIGGDGFGVGLGISNSNYADASCKGLWGSLLVGTIYTEMWRSIDCGKTFSLFMNGVCGAATGTLAAASANPCNLDYGSNFFMKMASEQGDATGQTVLTVINNSTCSASVSTCTPSAQSSVYVSHNAAAPGGSWQKANGTIALASGGTATSFPDQLLFVGSDSRTIGHWGVTTYSRAYTTLDGGATWQESASLPSPHVTSVAFETAAGTTLWATSKADPASSLRHVFRSTDRGATWTDKSGTGLPSVPANTVKVDPNDANTIYLGTEIGLYRSIDGGASWARYGTGLPLVSVTELSIALDGSVIRVSTFGRGFWELYPATSQAAMSHGVYGNGDFDRNQQIDGFDLVREAAVLGETPATLDYDQTGNLTGDTNLIDGADFNALLLKLGQRP